MEKEKVYVIPTAPTNGLEAGVVYESRLEIDEKLNIYQITDIDAKRSRFCILPSKFYIFPMETTKMFPALYLGDNAYFDLNGLKKGSIYLIFHSDIMDNERIYVTTPANYRGLHGVPSICREQEGDIPYAAEAPNALLVYNKEETHKNFSDFFKPLTCKSCNYKSICDNKDGLKKGNYVCDTFIPITNEVTYDINIKMTLSEIKGLGKELNQLNAVSRIMENLGENITNNDKIWFTISKS